MMIFLTIVALLVLVGIVFLSIQAIGSNKAMSELKSAIERVRGEVEEIGNAVEAGVRTFEQIAALLRENAADAAAVNLLADQLDEHGKKLAAAVAANTEGDADVSDDDLVAIPVDDSVAGEAGGEGTGGGADGDEITSGDVGNANEVLGGEAADAGNGGDAGESAAGDAAGEGGDAGAGTGEETGQA